MKEDIPYSTRTSMQHDFEEMESAVSEDGKIFYPEELVPKPNQDSVLTMSTYDVAYVLALMRIRQEHNDACCREDVPNINP